MWLMCCRMGFRQCRNMFSRLSLTRFLILLFAPLSSMHKGLYPAYSCRFFLSFSSIHFCRRGCSLHMFFKLSYRASTWQMVIWPNTFPKRTPRVSPTSAWVYPGVILFCFKSLANYLRSLFRALMSSFVSSSGFGSSFITPGGVAQG